MGVCLLSALTEGSDEPSLRVEDGNSGQELTTDSFFRDVDFSVRRIPKNRAAGRQKLA